MQIIEANVECAVAKSFRVQALSGIFDVQIEEKVKHSFKVEVPGLEEPWSVGIIVGPSGAGKSTVARAAFGDHFFEPSKIEWPKDMSFLEGFPKEIGGKRLDVRTITDTLTSVGFSSPPSWVKPFNVLSNGQKFRAELAMALLADQPVIAVDEFSSVVDRAVAKTCATAVAKAVRRGTKKFVAISCHHDIVPYMEPDWVLDMSTQELARGSLPRPKFEIEVVRAKNEAWRLFRDHHYLAATLHPAAQCYMAMLDGEPVAFCAMLHTMGFKGYWRVSRVVVLPDYQGIGIGTRLMEWACQCKIEEGAVSVRIQGSHPAVVWHCDRHKDKWRLVEVKEAGNTRQTNQTKARVKAPVTSIGRPIANFEYIGGPR